MTPLVGLDDPGRPAVGEAANGNRRSTERFRTVLGRDRRPARRPGQLDESVVSDKPLAPPRSGRIGGRSHERVTRPFA